jgi:hypothetical protein
VLLSEQIKACEGGLTKGKASWTLCMVHPSLMLRVLSISPMHDTQTTHDVIGTDLGDTMAQSGKPTVNTLRHKYQAAKAEASILGS